MGKRFAFRIPTRTGKAHRGEAAPVNRVKATLRPLTDKARSKPGDAYTPPRQQPKAVELTFKLDQHKGSGRWRVTFPNGMRLTVTTRQLQSPRRFNVTVLRTMLQTCCFDPTTIPADIGHEDWLILIEAMEDLGGREARFSQEMLDYWELQEEIWRDLQEEMEEEE